MKLTKSSLYTLPEIAIWSIAIAIIVYMAFNSVVYGTFHFDDVPNILQQDEIHIEELSASSLLNALMNGHLQRRAIANLSFAIDWYRGNGKAEPFLVSNLTIHTANAIIVFLLLVKIFKGTLQYTTPGQRPTHSSLLQFFYRKETYIYLSAALSATIWAVHPIQTQSVAYIVQRMTELSALFVLLTTLCYIIARERQLDGRRASIWYGATGVCMLLAFFSKENSWIAPVLLWLVEFTLFRRSRPLITTSKDRVIFYLPAIIVGVAVIDLITGSGPLSTFVELGYAIRDFTLPERLLTQPSVILYHLSQIIWPIPSRFSLVHDVTIATSIVSPWWILPSIIALIVWISVGAILLFDKSKRIYSLFILWPLISLSIESSFIPLEMVFEHRMYLPSTLIFGFGGYILLAYLTNKRGSDHQKIFITVAILFLISILIVGLVHSTQRALEKWRSGLDLYSHAVKVAPGSARAWNNLGSFAMRNNLKEIASHAFNKAIEVDPRFVGSYVNRAALRGVVYNDYQSAMADLSKAVGIDASFAEIYLTRGSIHLKYNDIAHAIDDLEHWMIIDGEKTEGLFAYGKALARNRQYTEAVLRFDQVLNIDADHYGARYFKALALLKLGKSEEALEAARYLLANHPENNDIHTLMERIESSLR